MLPFRSLHQRGTSRLVSALASSSSFLSPSSRLSDRRCFHGTPSLKAISKRPQMESFERRLMRAMTEPVYPQEVLYPVRVKKLTAYQEHRIEWLDYMSWLVGGVLERNQVFGFFFCTKPEDRREFNRMQQTFRNAGLMLQDWKAEDISIVVEGTKYENMQKILKTNVLFCYPFEPFKEGMPKDYVPPPQIDNMTAVKEMIRLGRILPLVTLLGGVIEDEMMTRARMAEYIELGSLDSQRGQLCSLLSTVPSTTSSLLSHHQNVLGATLAAYVAEKTKPIEVTEAEEGT